MTSSSLDLCEKDLEMLDLDEQENNSQELNLLSHTTASLPHICPTAKRSASEIAASPRASPKKRVKKVSAISDGLKKSSEGDKPGLFKYNFNKCTSEEFAAQAQRAANASREIFIERETFRLREKEEKTVEKREGNRLCQQKHRAKKQALEVAEGLRSPGGTKRSQSLINPVFSQPGNQIQRNMAELSHPARASREVDFIKSRKPQGRKRKHEKSQQYT